MRFWITSSTEEEERLRRVLKRAWIRENSSARTLMISSIASCPVQTTQTFPLHSLPIFSTKDCRFSSISVSVPTYCPASSTMNRRRKFAGFVLTYALMSSTSCETESSVALLSLNQLFASSSLISNASASAGLINFPLNANAFRTSVQGLPFFSSIRRQNSSILPCCVMYCSSIATLRLLPKNPR